MIRERTMRLPGLRIGYREAGEPAAEAVFLLHALGLDASDWDAVSDALSDRFHVFAVDLRGFGPGPHPGHYSFELMRDDVLAFADALGIEKFSLMGHSMGGTVAYLVAEKAPERVVRMVVEDTPPPWGADVQEVPEIPPAPVRYDWEALRAIVAQLKSSDPRWWDELPDIECPVLIVGGGETSHVPQDLLGRVAQLIPNARLTTVERAGHNVHADRFDEFMALVEEFFAG